MIRAYRYKMKPTAEQQEYLSRCFGCARFVYNHALAERVEAYRNDRKSLSFFDQCTSLRKLKKQDEYSWLKDVPALTLNYSLLNLNNAYNHFFKTKGGFPKYKSKKTCKESVKFEPNSTKYDFNEFKVRIPKCGWIALCKERIFDQSAVKIQSTTVSRDNCGVYWCTVAVDDNASKPPKAKVQKETAVGIDLGIADFAVLSTGERIQNERFTETEERRIATAQRCLSRKQRGDKNTPPSKRYVRYRTRLARIHQRTQNRRTDYLQKLSTSLVRQYDTICIEDLNVKGMMRNRHLAGAIGSAAWSEFVRMLEYKSEWTGVNLLRAGRFDPTSQLCSVCGFRNTDTKDLSVREWTCPQCGTRHDRDINAARNILTAAFDRHFNQQSPGVTGITDADGADSENKTGTRSRICDYASEETSRNQVEL